ncbi:MAG: flagellar assembly protein FliW [Chromatiales bacterium]|nr:flagellar assembly protein FliW [Chromatiales bacterium]
MQLNHDTVGSGDIHSESVIHFPFGIPGFEQTKDFLLSHSPGKEMDLYWLTAKNDESVMFSLIDPTTLNVHYEFVLSDEEITTLQLDEPTDVAVLIMIYGDQNASHHRRATDSRVNAHLMGPIVLNTKTRLGLQKVLGDAQQVVTIRESSL